MTVDKQYCEKAKDYVIVKKDYVVCDSFHEKNCVVHGGLCRLLENNKDAKV